MGNQGIIVLAVIGIAAVGAYVLNIGGIKDKINSLLSGGGLGKPQCMALGLCVQGYTWDATACKCVPSGTQGIAVGEFNPAIPKGSCKPPNIWSTATNRCVPTKGPDCPAGQELVSGKCKPIPHK